MCKVNYAFIVKLIMPLILLPAVVTGSGVWLINALIGGLNSRSTASDGVMALTMRRNCVYMTPRWPNAKCRTPKSRSCGNADA